MKVTLPLQEDTAHEALPTPGGPILWHAGALAELASRLSGHEQLVHRSSRRASRDGTRPLQERSQVAPRAGQGCRTPRCTIDQILREREVLQLPSL